ncbi:MAG: TatD family hydrolase [Gammaproteobacteria bacterium]|nr:TatD family hydrolase [Gammaproteobacteria bacterium]
MLIDTHCHIDVDAFNDDRDDVINNAHALGVMKLIVPAIQSSSWDHLLMICQQYDDLYPALGLHPVYQDSHQPSDIDQLEAYIQLHQPVAVGEIGLDYYIQFANKEKQQFYLDAQLALARQYKLPVILHVRKAHDQMLKSLKNAKLDGGICHAFNGSLQQAHQYINLGFKLGFGGMLTYGRSHKLKMLAQSLPLDSIVLETDAPDMSGALHNGQRNSPEYLPEVLEVLCSLRNMDKTTLSEQLYTNLTSCLPIQ